MGQILSFLKKHWITLFIVGLFVVTRAYVWINRPLDFTEIIYSYMPYAHLWASGVKPYLEQWYEYPPVTIPLFYIPHLIDKETYGSFLHINYLQGYRGLLLIIDIALFALVWRSLIRFDAKPSVRWIALIYYCLITAKANHFLYDTMDWAFAASLTLSAAPSIFIATHIQITDLRSFGTALQSWIGYWLAVGLKLLNGPLGLPLALMQRLEWRTKWPALLFGGGLVWVVPVLMYRSSLSVMVLFHQIRGLQVDSFVAIIVRIINSFTQTESIVEIYKNYEMRGPITTQALIILNVVFVISLVLFTAWIAWQAWKIAPHEKQHAAFRVSITLGFILLLMLISKVLSRPFVLWHIPLLAILPVANWKQQVRFLVPSILAVAITLSAVPDITVGIFRTATLVGVLRSAAFLWLFVEWLRWHKNNFRKF